MVVFYRCSFGLGDAGFASQFGVQVRHAFFVGVANQNRAAAFFRNGNGFVELGFQRLIAAVVIQKYIPRQPRNARRFGLPGGTTVGNGAAVDKEQLALLRDVHGPAHFLAVLGQQAAHMIVEAADVRDDIQTVIQRLLELLFGHVRVQATGTQRHARSIGHRRMQHHVMALLPGLFGQSFGVGSFGQESQINGGGQADGLLAQGAVVADVVNHNNQFTGAGTVTVE